MSKIFSFDGWYYRTFTFLTNLILVNFLFLLTAGTVVLLGPGLVALYKTVYKLYRERDISAVKTFGIFLKDNLVRGFYLTAIMVTWLGLMAASMFFLFNISIQLSILAIILFSLATLSLSVFTILYSLFSLNVKETFNEMSYVVLSSSANAIILFIIPVFVFAICLKINLFLLLSLGIAMASLLQIMFFVKVLEVQDESI